MCVNCSKTKSEIMKHYQKDHISFVILNHRSWDIKSLLEKAKPKSVDSSSDKPKALLRNVAFQPFIQQLNEAQIWEQLNVQFLLKTW